MRDDLSSPALLVQSSDLEKQRAERVNLAARVCYTGRQRKGGRTEVQEVYTAFCGVPALSAGAAKHAALALGKRSSLLLPTGWFCWENVCT